MSTKPKLFHHDKPLVGLDISQTDIKIMSIDSKNWKVNGYGSIALDPAKLQNSLIKGDEYLSQRIGDLLKNNIVGRLPSNHAALCIPTSKTYSRMISLPIEALSHLEEAILLEAEQYIPVALSELNIAHQIIEQDKKTISVLLSAVPRRVVDNIVFSCERNDLVVVFAEPGISAVARLITKHEEGNLPTIIVDIGAASTDIAVLNKMIRVSGGVSVGGNSFTLDISKKLGLSLEESHQIKILEGLAAGPKRVKLASAIKPSLDIINTEIQKLLRYYSERLGVVDKIQQVIIVGGGSSMPGLGEYFTDTLTLAARVASPWQAFNFGKLEQPSRLTRPRYIGAAGLACLTAMDIWS